MSSLPLKSPEATTSMHRLARLRWWLLAGEIAAILAVPEWLDITLPQWPMLCVVGLQMVANALALFRIKRCAAFSDGEFCVQLVLDILALSVLMFLSGGAANPLISLLLPPVAIAALALPARLVVAVAGLAVAAYSVLNLVYLPLPVVDVARATRLHLAGMWFTFVVSVLMLAWFVVRLRASLRQRETELADAREIALRDERVIALGALAAGAAHELSTPLATMAIVLGELELDETLGEDARADVSLLRQQIAACKAIISRLAERAGAERLDSAAAQQADGWLRDLHARWQTLRLHAKSQLQLAGTMPAPSIIADPALEHGLLNLFNNAADTATAVSVRADWDTAWLTLEVRDHGPGFSAEVLAKAGRAPFPAHAAGSGIGLFLAHAAIARLGGQLDLRNEGGAIARIRLPIRSLS